MNAEEMKARLAAIKAEKARQAAEREALNADRLLAEQLESAERELKDDAALIEAEREHGPSYVYGEEEPGARKLAVVKTALGAVILKRAHANIFKRWVDSAKADEAANYQLVSPSVVYPDKARFEAMVDEQPMILTRCATAVAELAGARLKELQGKY